jgi:AcrR family transcriptional regulator
MATVFGDTARPASDLTARARIRDAALTEFARRGYDGTTMRAVADAAGVSVGLVQHHFGTKEGLRKACDDAVMELVQRKIDASRAGDIDRPDVLAALSQQAAGVIGYLGRAALDGSPGAATILQRAADATAAFLSETWPERFPAGSGHAGDAAAVLLAMNLGPVLLREQVARLAGINAEVALPPRLGVAMVEVYAALGEYVTSGPGRGLRTALEEGPS